MPFRGVVLGQSTPELVETLLGSDGLVLKARSGEISSISYMDDAKGRLDATRLQDRARPWVIGFRDGRADWMSFGAMQKCVRLPGGLLTSSSAADLDRVLSNNDWPVGLCRGGYSYKKKQSRFSAPLGVVPLGVCRPWHSPAERTSQSPTLQSEIAPIEDRDFPTLGMRFRIDPRRGRLLGFDVYDPGEGRSVP
jgi:hypothetical protein